MNFLKRFIAAFLAVIAAFWVLVIGSLLFFTAIASMEESAVIPKHSVLKVNLNAPIVDYKGSSGDDVFEIFQGETIALSEVLQSIEGAAMDENIEGISLETPYFMGGWGQAEAIRNALIKFKESGKFVYSYADAYSQGAYYIASVADSIYVTPAGIIDLRGLSSELTYYKSFQEKTGLKMEVIRHGKYKSAVEPYLNDAPSEENLMQIQTLIDDLWEGVAGQMAESHGIVRDEFESWVSSRISKDLNASKAVGLVDDLIYIDQYKDILERAVKGDSAGSSSNESLKTISISKYYTAMNPEKVKTSDRIAVVYAQGTIYYGEGTPQIMGQTTMNKALENARKDNGVKAVVLRINSPGGSALTSDLIWREVAKTAAQKPLVVSISDVAASGGYYIATPAQYILAQSTSITGSIGVFGTLPNASELASEWGVKSYTVSTHPRAATYSPLRPLSDDFRAELTEGIEQTYQTFLSRVAEGRDMDIERVDELAQGRVYSAKEALEVGLIDEIGGLDEAIAKAAELAGIQDYRLREYPRFKSAFERLFEDFSSASLGRMVQDQLPEFAQQYMRFWELPSKEAASREMFIQARMPFDLNID